MAANGLFITFEGSEGCGKSTQMRRISEFLRSTGREVISLREPGGTPIGEVIRHLLKHDENANSMTPEAELLLFVASRAQLVREVIRPALKRGAIVLCDRFLDSTTVYQGVARKLDAKNVAIINSFAINGTLPDLTLVFDLDATEGCRRAHGRSERIDRMELEAAEFYEAVRRGYLEQASLNPERMVVVDASGSEEFVENLIKAILKERFHGIF